ncbi:hypothetical protein M413DRAFT_256733 [Hebeloma cylindrosporum]|uniref:Myb-like domain-containing protein n=1 Tax=Hebeloma cylindrosporum TaxID=76867 RepID=A0A0C3C0L0_HEBCY|nr:hypothetical protein M413DRAFT_256733 [Hebeloma cylindrosporum h7]
MTTPNPNPQSSVGGGLPSSSTFSFKAPFPPSVSALKHRRVSLASPSSPRLVQPWSFRDEMGLDIQPPTPVSAEAGAASSSPPVPEKKGKVRKLDATGDVQDKKPRKKWSNEETQMLVQGCQIHGVGNWKTILQDPDLKFHDRSAVDLKDRFRTYFPDAYQRHYPNARTHLSSKIRSTLADGTSLFEKTRSKRRRPFTDAEDRALKAGYEKHGTTWATIVKDPIFAEQNRRSTDLRDRFRNAFPDLYQAAGYKPRSATKRKKLDGVLRAADDQLSTTAGPVRSRRRAKTTSQGLLRGGTKSVPQSTACSEDEESEEESESSQVPPTPVFVENVSTASYRSPTKKSQTTTGTTTTSAPTLSDTQIIDADDEMELLTLDSTDALNIPDFLPNNAHSDLETWSSGLNTPTHSSTAAWSTAAVSPTSSHLSFMNPAAGTSTTSGASSPFIQRRTGNPIGGNGSSIDNNFGMIGKSAWGTAWFSTNPRLDASASSSNSNSSSSFMDPANFSPASPFSFQGHLNHGVLDRYDLFPPYMPDGNVSEAGLGDIGGQFGDDDEMAGGGNGAGASSGGTGFKGYHSQIAGDLISGTGARMHHHHHYHQHHNHHQPTAFSLSSLYGTSFASGFGNSAAAAAEGASSSSSLGLGLEGIPENENVNVRGIHPMQLHSHTSSSLSLEAINELGLTGISLNESGEVRVGDGAGAGGSNNERQDDAMDEGDEGQQAPSQLPEKRDGVSDNVGAGAPASSGGAGAGASAGNGPQMEEDPSLPLFGMEDLVDMNELHHVTPPATPFVTQPRPMRRVEGSMMLGGFAGFGAGGGVGAGAGAGGHARSISVPPSEARNGHHHDMGVAPMSVDDVGLHSMHLGYPSFGGMPPSNGMESRSLPLHSIFNASSLAVSGSIFNSASGAVSGHGSPQAQERHHQQQFQERQHIHSPISPTAASLHQQQQQQQQQGHVDDDDDHSHHTSELTPLFPANLILSPANSAASVGLPSSSSQSSERGHPNGASNGGGSHHHTPVIDHRHTPVIDHHHTPVIEHDQQRDEIWRSASSFSSFSDYTYTYNLPFLDLHYYSAGGAGSMMFGNPNNHAHGQVNHHPNHLNHSHPSHANHLNHSHLHPHHLNLHNTLGLDVSSMDDLYSTTAMTVEATRQGQALDLAQTNAQMGSSFTVGMGGIGFNSHAAIATGNLTANGLPLPSRGFDRTPSPSGTIRHHRHQRRPLLDDTFTPPPDPRVAGSAVVDGNSANVNGKGSADGGRHLSDGNDTSKGNSANNNASTSNSMSRSSSDDSRTGGGRAAGRVRKSTTAGSKLQTNAVRSTPTPTPPTTATTTAMPTTTMKVTAMTRTPTTTTTATIGRSMSHHRGQSAASAAAANSSVCPRDLMLRSGDNHKRKRASWDGGVN